MQVIDCNNETLEVYAPSAEMPWNKTRVMHLYRRIGHSASMAEIDAALQRDPAALIDEIVDTAITQPLITPPEWADKNLLDFAEDDEQLDIFLYWRPQWIKDIYQKGLREKLTVFWSNHFVTQFTQYYCAPAGYKYLICLQENALGNFKEFVHKIGLEAAMLIFLNGTQNTKVDPNENYARELYELFTLGRDNGYTQNDIKETARALTGYVVYPCPDVNFISGIWDDGEKNIFGRVGNWGYDDVIDILFEEKAELIARHISQKIYREFVHAGSVNEDIIQEMANILIAEDFEIAPVVRALLKSQHFFADEIIGTQIKSPLDITINFWKEFGLEITEEALKGLTDVSDFLGQILFQPPNVAGWPGYHTWITSSFLRTRWQVSTLYISIIFEQDKELFRALAKGLAGDSKDPDYVTREIVDHFTSKGFLDEDLYDRATAAFKSEIPEGYFTSGQWNLDWSEVPAQVAYLLFFITRQPEFQLI